MTSIPFNDITAVVRTLTLCRARYLETGSDSALEMWEDASAVYFNLTGRDHPLARYAPEDR